MDGGEGGTGEVESGRRIEPSVNITTLNSVLLCKVKLLGMGP